MTTITDGTLWSFEGLNFFALLPPCVSCSNPDVADLALGRNLALDRWLNLAPGIAEAFVATYSEAFGAKPAIDDAAGLTAIKSGSRGVVLGHPLWRRDQLGWNDQQQSAVNELVTRGVGAVSVIDIREARAYPEAVYRALR
jgi:DEAD/DEAH box helicase domain-containing protein